MCNAFLDYVGSRGPEVLFYLRVFGEAEKFENSCRSCKCKLQVYKTIVNLKISSVSNLFNRFHIGLIPRKETLKKLPKIVLSAGNDPTF